ncbi:MAG TPA: hypothetical protein VJ821_10580 [Anaerolineales bacterium]|nr:hypothetical protein [Anaerolineales bacterium]
MNAKSLSVFALVLLLNACSPFTIVSSSGEQPTPQEVTSSANPQSDLKLMQVEHVEVFVGVGSPIPVEIVASGIWPSLCSQIAEVKSQIHGFQIDVTLLASTVEPCPPDSAGLSFRFALPLNYVELPHGTYTITVNGTGTTFEWPVKTEAMTGSISGWVWHDECVPGVDGQPAPTSPPSGCVEEASSPGLYRANGILDQNELPIEGLRVTLREGDCAATSLTGIKDEVMTISSDLSYTFTGVKAGTYCISIDSLQEPNLPLLLPGGWSYPYSNQSLVAQTVTLTAGENKHDVNFGWDHQFK